MVVQFKITHSQAGTGRTGELVANGHALRTPNVVQVGSVTGTISGPDLQAVGVAAIKQSALKWWLRYGDHLSQLGDLHDFLHWDGLLLVDPGEKQAYHWAKPRGRKKGGVSFHDPADHQLKFYTPQIAADLQVKLGSDLNPTFARAAGYYDPVDDLNAAVDQTNHWLTATSPANALGAVVGGGLKRARQKSVTANLTAGFTGVRLAGIDPTVPLTEQKRIVDEVLKMLPEAQLRYLPTIGSLEHLLVMLNQGIDLVDSDLASRQAALGNAIVGFTTLHLDREHFALDRRVLAKGCQCPVCQAGISRAVIHHFLLTSGALGIRYLLLHNLTVVNQLVSKLQTAINAGQGTEFLENLAQSPKQ